MPLPHRPSHYQFSFVLIEQLKETMLKWQIIYQIYTISFQVAKNLVVPGAKRGKPLIRQSHVKKEAEPGPSSSPEAFEYEPTYSRDQR